jgi:hypothetical protein
MMVLPRRKRRNKGPGRIARHEWTTDYHFMPANRIFCLISMRRVPQLHLMLSEALLLRAPFDSPPI